MRNQALCPFCGYAGEIRFAPTRKKFHGAHVHVACANCEARGPWVPVQDQSEAEAIAEAWKGWSRLMGGLDELALTR